MYPVSPAFLAAVVADSQVLAIKATAYLGDDVLGDLMVVGGSVTVDGTSGGALRSLSLTLAPDDDAWDWVTSAGAEIRVWRGLTLAAGDELAALGVFVLDADPDEALDGTITLSAADRSVRISRARWVDPYILAAGTDVGDAIAGILSTCWPACPIGFTQLGKTLGASSVLQDGANSDPWKDARAVALTAGYDLYFDANGIAKVRLIPDPSATDPCMTYGYGNSGVVLTRKRVAMLSLLYNGVIATGQGTSAAAPVRGECWDEDPTSPTYRYGPLGQIPYFYSSPLLVTADEAASAAASLFASVRGRMEQVTFEIVPNPALEAFDVVEFDASDGTVSRYMFDTVVIPLDNSSMSATARETVMQR